MTTTVNKKFIERSLDSQRMDCGIAEQCKEEVSY